MNKPPSAALVDIVSAIRDLCNEAGVDKEVRTGPEALYPNILFITLNILKDLFGFNSESGFLRYAGKHHHDFFPHIPKQSWFNRKSKKLKSTVRDVHTLLLQKLYAHRIEIRIVDTTGVPVVKLHRAHYCKGFEQKTEANYGYCAAKKSYYYGEKLTLLTTPNGIPTSYVLTPANVHDVRALKENLSDVAHDIEKKIVIGDLGYYDGALETELKEVYASKLITPEKKRHQKRNTTRDKKLLKLRSGIERINEQLQDHMHIDETRARSQTGLEARIQSIITSFTFGIYFNMLCGRNILSLKSLVT